MKKLLIPLALLFSMTPPQAHAGYFAFHADVVGQIGDILGDYGRPDSDEPDCEIDDKASCDDAISTPGLDVIAGFEAWLLDILDF